MQIKRSVLASLPLGLVASFSLCTLASLSSRLGAHDVPLSCSPVWVQVAFSGSTVSCAGIICLVLNFQEFFHKFFRLISASVVKTVWRCGFMYGNSVSKGVLFIQVGLSFLCRPSSSLSCISSCTNWCQTPRGPLPLWSISDPSVACVSITTLPIKETGQNTGFLPSQDFVANTATGLGSFDRSLRFTFEIGKPICSWTHWSTSCCFLKNACHTRWLARISYIFLLTCALWPPKY